MRNDERETREPDDAEFIADVAAAYSPPELTRSRRAAIDAGVRERTQRRPRIAAWGMALATGSVAAVFAVVLVRATGNDTTSSPASAPSVASASPGNWTYSVLLETIEGQSHDRLEELPDDYQAIADVWLEG